MMTIEEKIRFYIDTLQDLCNRDLGLQWNVAQDVPNWHRAIQNNMFHFCIYVLKAIAQQHYYDGRNERAVLHARIMLETIGIDWEKGV